MNFESPEFKSPQEEPAPEEQSVERPEQREAEEFISEIIDSLKEGTMGFTFSGKIGDRYVPERTVWGKKVIAGGGYERVDVAGLRKSDKYPTHSGYWAEMITGGRCVDNKIIRGNVTAYHDEVLRRVDLYETSWKGVDIDGMPLKEKVDDLVVVSGGVFEKQEGTTKEVSKREQKGFLGRPKVVEEVREVPRMVRVPLKLKDVLINGGDEPARIITLIRFGFVEQDPRPHENKYHLIVSESVIEKLFGGKDSPGGLLRQSPDLLERLLERIAPELVGSEIKRINSGEKRRRRALVIAPNFSSSSVYETAISSENPLPLLRNQLREGKLVDNIIEYNVERKLSR